VSEPIILGRIVIERILTEDGGDVVEHSTEGLNGGVLPVIETLGMLALVEDAVLHAPEEE
jgi:hypothetical protein